MTVFLYLLGFGVMIPLIPHLSRDMGATSTEAGLLMATYSLMQFLFAPVWGRWSDRVGRRKILLFSLAMESVSYLAFAFARQLEALFLARALTGFFGASLSTANAAMADVTSAQDRSKGMALIGAAFGLGFILGPAIGGGAAVIADQISQAPFFRTTFVSLLVSALFALTFIFAYFKLPETLPEDRRQATKRRRLAGLFEKLKTPVTRELILAFFLVSFAMSSMEATLVYFMADRFSWNLKDTSFGFAYIGLVLVLTQGYLVRRFLPRFGERHILVVALPVFVVGLALIAPADSIAVMALSMTLIALGVGHTNPSLNGSISLMAHESEQGSTLGLTQSLSSLGRILGPAAGGALYAWSSGAPFWFSTALALGAWVLILSRYRSLPERALMPEDATRRP
ncbi:MAG: MFS transporter [Bdellovibrionales bacterium]